MATTARLISSPRTVGTDIEATITVMPSEDHVVDARQFVGAKLTDWGLGTVVDTAVLLTSEVATNAIVHAGPGHIGAGLSVLVRNDAGIIRVEVADWSSSVPVRGDRAIGGLSGRGLLLLDALASSWGSTPNGAGKSVWFEIDVEE